MISPQILFLLMFLTLSKGADNTPKRIDLKNEVLPPCKACKTLVSSFMNAVSKVKKNNSGGNEKANFDKNVKLNEIKKTICEDVERGYEQCKRLVEEWENNLEECLLKLAESNSDIFQWLCIEKVKHCCPDNHFGPDCKPCEGYPDSVCSNNGKCKGSGTRKGNGECICDPGYVGPKCNECSTSYYESYKDKEKVLCSKCHNSCKSSCSSPGPKGCKDCNSGWINDPEHGCLDINECASLDPCKKNQFCVNNEGSYSCLACDQSCSSCYGDGPDMCIECAPGYSIKEGMCVSKDEAQIMDWGRYTTYFGLSVATCIILQKNPFVASFVGVFVAIYIAVSEFTLSNLSRKNQMF